MKIKAKIGGELILHGQGSNWIHKAGDVREFSEVVGKKILTSQNYEKAIVKKVLSVQEKKIEITATLKPKEEKKDNGGK